MRVGSLFAGIGGLDWAAEQAFGARTAWQLDLTGEQVRTRHFPGAQQIVADVAKVDPLSLPPIDVLCGGFACQDLSAAIKERQFPRARLPAQIAEGERQRRGRAILNAG